MSPQSATLSGDERSSFQRALAEFTLPEKKFPPARDDAGLLPDFATFSDQTQGERGRVDQAVGSLPGHWFDTRLTIAEADLPLPAIAAQTAPPKQAEAHVSSSLRKCASVTIRLTEQESNQLRQRSEEAGISISAYLRSCAFEVEELRAEVRATVAKLQGAAGPHTLKRHGGTLLRSWLHRWVRWRARRRRHRTLG